MTSGSRTFWVFKEHHGYLSLFEVADSVMPELVKYFESEGDATSLIEESGDAELEEAWEVAKKTPTVENVLRFSDLWDYSGLSEENVTRLDRDSVHLKP